MQVLLSAREIDKLTVLKRVEAKRLTQREAAGILSVSERHVRRLLPASCFAPSAPPERLVSPQNDADTPAIAELMELRFAPAETTLSYFEITRKYVER